MRVRRSVLLAFGFASLLLIIALSAVAVWRNARNAQARVAALHEAHSRAASALSAIRADSYLIGLLRRDYLLEEDPDQVPRYLAELNKIRRATEEEFASLKTSAQDDEQQSAIRKLKAQFDAYWDPTEITLQRTPAQKWIQRRQVLNERGRRRQEVFALTEQVEQMLTANYRAERQRIISADREFGVSLGWITGSALLLGMGVAGATLARMIKLERQSVAAEMELRRLSGQLRTTQEQERRNLSRELHDQVGQMLTGLRMELASMARLHGDTDSELSNRIARAKGAAEQTLRVVRNIAMLLRPSMLDDLGLTPALTWLAKEISRSSGIEIRADIDPALDSLPDAHRTCIYRVVQEALTNAVRHSGASRVDLSVARERGSISVKVMDDGRGFDRASVKQKGLGLIGMEERAIELGGGMRIESLPGRGACVEVRLPCPAKPEETNDQDPDSGRSRDRAHRVETPV